MTASTTGNEVMDTGVVPTSTGTPEQVTPVVNANTTNPNVAPAPDPNRPTSGPTVRLIGRFDTTNPNAAVFAWPASTMLTRINGTGVSISLTDPNRATYAGATVHNYYDVFVDGVKTSVIQIVAGTTNYVAAANLPAGDHIIKVSKRTEAQMGPGIFGGFTPAAGTTLLPAPLPSARRIQFIGDSITAGFGADGNVATQSGCAFSAATENADATFASMTADNLDAEFHAIAFSGKGIVQNNDCKGDPYYTMPILYTATIPIGDAANEKDVDFKAWVPQAIVINLGTNDYNQDNGCGVPSSAVFTRGWVDFIKVVRSYYPSAAIFATVGPDLQGSVLATSQANIAAAVSSLNKSGDNNVFVVVLPENKGADGYGCAGHPNKTTHQGMASIVTSAIQKQLGW